MLSRSKGFAKFYREVNGEVTCYRNIKVFSRLALKELINNLNSSRLISAFEWKTTPQGHKYWSNIYERRTTFQSEDIEFMKELLKDYDVR